MSAFFPNLSIPQNIFTSKYDWSVVYLYYVTFDASTSRVSVDTNYQLLPFLEHYEKLGDGKSSCLLVDVAIPGIPQNNQALSVKKMFEKLNTAKEIQNLPAEFELMRYMFMRFLSLIYLSDALAIQGDIPLFNSSQIQSFKTSFENSEEMLAKLFNDGLASMYENSDDKLFQWNNFMGFNICLYTSQDETLSIDEFPFINAYNIYILKMLLMYKQDPDSFSVPLLSLLVRVVTYRRSYIESKYIKYFIDDVKIKLTDDVPQMFSSEELISKMTNICKDLILRPLHVDVIQNRFDLVKCVKAKVWGQPNFGYYSPVINGLYPNMWKLYKISTTSDYNSVPLIKTKAEVVAWSGGDVQSISKFPYYVIIIHKYVNETTSEFTAMSYLSYLKDVSSFKNLICLSNHKELHSNLSFHRLGDDLIDSTYMPIGYNWMIQMKDNKPKVYVWHRRHFDTNHAFIERLYQYQNMKSFHDQFNVFEMHRLFETLPKNLTSYFDYGKSNQLGCRMFSALTFADLTFQNLTVDNFVSRVKNAANLTWYFEMTGQRVMLPGRITDDDIQTVFSGMIQLCHSKDYDSNNIPFLFMDSDNLNYISTMRKTIQVKPSNWCRLAVKYPNSKYTNYTYFQQYVQRRPSDAFMFNDFGLINGRFAITSKTESFNPHELFLHQELNLKSVNVPLVLFTHDLIRFDKLQSNLHNLRETAKFYSATVTFSGGRKLSFGNMDLVKLEKYSTDLYKNDMSNQLPAEFYHAQFYSSIEEINNIIDSRFFPVGGTFLTFLMNCGMLMKKREFRFQMNSNVDSVQRLKPFNNEVSDAFMYLDLRADLKNVIQFFNSLNVWLYRHFQFWVFLLPIPDNDESDQLYHIINYQSYVDKVKTIQRYSGAIKPTFHRYYLVFMPYGSTSVTNGKFVYSFTFSKNKSINKSNNLYTGDLCEYLAISEHVSNPGLFHVTHESRLNSFDYVNGKLRRIYFDEMNRISMNIEPKLTSSDVMYNTYSIETCLKIPYLDFQKIMFDVQGNIAKFKVNTSEDLSVILVSVFDENKLYPYQLVIYLMLKYTNNVKIKNVAYSKILELVRKYYENPDSDLGNNNFMENYFMCLLNQPHMSLSECIRMCKPLIFSLNNQLDDMDTKLNNVANETKRYFGVATFSIDRPLYKAQYKHMELFDWFVRSSASLSGVDLLRYEGFMTQVETELLDIKFGILSPFVRYFNLQLNDKDSKEFNPSPIDRSYFKLDRHQIQQIKSNRGNNSVDIMDAQLSYVQDIQTSLDDVNDVLMLIALWKLNKPEFDLKYMRACPILYYHYLSIFTEMVKYAELFISDHFDFVFEIVYILKTCSLELQSFARTLNTILKNEKANPDIRMKCRLIIMSILSILKKDVIFSCVFNTLRHKVLQLPYEVFDDSGLLVNQQTLNVISKLNDGNKLKLPTITLKSDSDDAKYFFQMYMDIKFAVNTTYVPKTYKNDTTGYDYTSDKSAMKKQIEDAVQGKYVKLANPETFSNYKWWSFIKMQLIIVSHYKANLSGAFSAEADFFNKKTAEDGNKFQDIPKNIIEFIDKSLLNMGSKFSSNSLAASGKMKPLSSYHHTREVLNFMKHARIRA